MSVHSNETSGRTKATPQRARSGNCDGMTLVEVLIAMGLVTLLCGGLYGMTIQARRFAEHSRIAVEARSLARERMEEIVSIGRENLSQPSSTLLQPGTYGSSLGPTFVVRSPRVIWHNADRSVSSVSNGVYAEVHVDVAFRSPATRQMLTNTYSTIVH
jgi:Tfp pilus assembly protein PilV